MQERDIITGTLTGTGTLAFFNDNVDDNVNFLKRERYGNGNIGLWLLAIGFFY